MARLLLIALVARLIVCATATMSFINPPSHSNTNGDFSNAITYKQGQVVNVVSTPADPGHDSSVVLYQLNNKTGQYFGAWEYVTRMFTVQTFHLYASIDPQLTIKSR